MSHDEFKNNVDVSSKTHSTPNMYVPSFENDVFSLKKIIF